MSTHQPAGVVALAKLLSLWCLFKNHTFCIKKGVKTLLSLSVFLPQKYCQSKPFSLFTDIILTEPARIDLMCGYARSVYENIICTPGLDLSSCSCFPLTVAAFIIEREGHTEKEDLSDTRMPQESDLFLQLSILWHLYLAQQWWQSHTRRWFTDDGLWRKKLSESKCRHIPYQSSDPLISKACISKGHSGSSWQILLDAQVCASQKAGATLQAPLFCLRAREEESGPLEHIWDRNCYSPTCAFSLECCSHHPIHIITVRQYLCHCPDLLTHTKERNMGPGGYQEECCGNCPKHNVAEKDGRWGRLEWALLLCEC